MLRQPPVLPGTRLECTWPFTGYRRQQSDLLVPAGCINRRERNEPLPAFRGERVAVELGESFP